MGKRRGQIGIVAYMGWALWLFTGSGRDGMIVDGRTHLTLRNEPGKARMGWRRRKDGKYVAAAPVKASGMGIGPFSHPIWTCF